MDFSDVKINVYNLGNNWQGFAQEIWVKYDKKNSLIVNMDLFPYMMEELSRKSGSD